jgi:hypothetical protein
VGRNTKTKDPKAHGLCVLSQADGLPLAFLPTEGPAIAAAISPDGNYLAGIEAPIQLDDGQIIGKYRLLLWSRARIKQEGEGYAEWNLNVGARELPPGRVRQQL